MLITILGPTASGKTSLAARLAFELGADIISADSRQVYKGMTLGSGKDYAEYIINGKEIPCHLLDICEAGEEYNLHRYLTDFQDIYARLEAAGRQAVLCGGSGMYLEAVLRGFNVVSIPLNQQLRDSLEKMNDEALREKLLSYGPVHATADFKSRERLLSAIEQKAYYLDHAVSPLKQKLPSQVFGIQLPREEIRAKITRRLHQRLEAGMLDEVVQLIDQGVSVNQLIAYGLEYKWLTLHIIGRVSYQEMLDGLNTAIHRFAKRQMTWFRGMEKRGTPIDWIDGQLSTDEKLKIILDRLNKT